MPSQDEGRLSLALQAYCRQEFKSLRAAAESYDVPEATLRSRRRGITSKAETTANCRRFTPSKEEVLLQKVLNLVAQGHHPQRVVVEEMANTILYTKNPSQPQRIGKNWVANFIKRRPELSYIYNRKFDYQRAVCEDLEEFRRWFERVRKVITKYGVGEHDTYNFDETGFMIGVISTAKVITSSERKGRPRTLQPGNREWVTSIKPSLQMAELSLHF